jgi:hypothetical protein
LPINNLEAIQYTLLSIGLFRINRA